MSLTNPPDDPFQDFMSQGLRDQTRFEKNSDLRSIARFRRALRKEDQDALDDILVSMNNYWRLHEEAPHLTPLEFMLLSLVIEERKLVADLQRKFDELKSPSQPA